MDQQLLPPDVICEEYDHLHSCATVDEVRWILRHCGRHTSYWTYFTLRLTTGMRPDEACKLTLYHLSPDCGTITYRVDKPSTRYQKTQGYIQRRKHRRVTLDPWTQAQLRAYLVRTCRVVDGVFISPHPGQKLFPWTHMGVVGAYWYKMRQRMKREGYDSLRTIREYHRPKTGKHDRIYILRPHILRHFSASVMFYKLGNLASVRDWIKHDDVEITNGYLHSAEALGTTPEFLERSSWAVILGYDEQQDTLLTGEATAQTQLDSY